MSKSDYAEKKRINEYLEAYWNDLREGRAYPKEAEISISELEPVWKSCFLVKVTPGKTDAEKEFSYVYLGEDLIDAYGDDNNEKEICERLAYPSSMSLLHKFREVIETGKPVKEDAEFINTRNMLVKYRSNMLPLGCNESDAIGFIIGGMKWKSY